MSPKLDEKTITLSNGKLMPYLGLGCWQSDAGDAAAVRVAVEEALKCGYKHIDTAYMYKNEGAVGDGIQNWVKNHKGNREDIFVVTKLPSIGMTPAGVEKFLKKSLASLKLTYVDLYLVHTPIGFKGKNDNDLMPFGPDGKIVIDESTDLIAIWKAMEKMVDAGLTKSIGVSNYSIRQLRKTLANARIPPVVNQVELHVYYQQKKLQEFCKEKDIVITAYAPLGSPGRLTNPAFKASHDSVPRLLDDPVVALVAQNHKVTNAQILFRFLIQSGMTTIPKSVSAERIKTNGDVFGFKLSEIEMKALETLDKGEAAATFDFRNYPGVSDHPECEEKK